MIDKMTKAQLFEVFARMGRPVPPARTTRPVLLGLALHAYYLDFDDAMIEDDARDLRNPDPPLRPLSYDVARSVPSDTVKWDPKGLIQGHEPIGRVWLAILAGAAFRARDSGMLGVLARLRDAELRAARAEARVVELQPRAVLSA